MRPGRGGRWLARYRVFLAASSGALLALVWSTGGHPVAWAAVLVFAALSARDAWQAESPLRRNFPLLGRLYERLLAPRGLGAALRRLSVGPLPIDGETWAVVVARAGGEEAVASFGGRARRSLGLRHALFPVDPREVETRIDIGGRRCRAPYRASVLNVSALSFGAISRPALAALSAGAFQGGFACNSGEGGLHPALLDGGGAVVWQIGSAYFGCRDSAGGFDPARFQATASLPAVRMIEVKLSQGGKPGHGGILPGNKVTLEVARLSGIEPGRDSLCPARHPAFATPIDLMAFLERLRQLSGGKPVGIKLCVGREPELAALVEAMAETGLPPDFVTVDGSEGGAGAAPPEFLDHVGVPGVEAVALVHDLLRAAGLRDEVKIIASGGVALGADIVCRQAAGADLCAAARAFMLAMGCVQALECEADSCPTGIATQRRALQRGLVPGTKSARVAAYQAATVASYVELMAALGRRRARELEAGDVSAVMAQARRGEPKVVEGALARASRPGPPADLWPTPGRTPSERGRESLP